MPDMRMRNAWLVAKREYLERVRTRAFLIFTLLTPAIVVAWAVLPALLMRGGKAPERHLVMVAAQPELAEAAREKILHPPPPAEEEDREGEDTSAAKDNPALQLPKLTVDVSTDLSEAHRTALEKQLDQGAIDGFVWMDEESLKNHTVSFVTRHRSDFRTANSVRDAVTAAVMNAELAAQGLPGTAIDKIQRPYSLEVTQWANGKGSKSSGAMQFLAVFVPSFAMYMTVLLYAANVMRSVLAEKSSRILEVLMSTLNPAELMTGKIVGVGAVGLTQVAVWFGLGALLSGTQVAQMSSQFRSANLSYSVGLYFALFFVLGYFVYSGMSAALGAMVNSEQEAQQFNFIIMLPLIISFFYVFRAISAPTDPVVIALSFFPLSSPIIMYTRIVIQSPPLWQIVLSVVLLLLGIVTVIWISARIYRVGILMYGKRPTLPEILKWVRQA